MYIDKLSYTFTKISDKIIELTSEKITILCTLFKFPKNELSLQKKVYMKKRVIIYGLGKRYQIYKNMIGEKYEVIGVTSSNPSEREQIEDYIDLPI